MSDAYSNKDSDYFSHVRQDVAPLLPKKINRALEIGCGAGNTLQWLKRDYNARWIAGVELCNASAVVASKQLDFFVQGNIEELELSIESASIDVLLCLDVLEHLVDPWRVIDRLTKLLSPSGVLIVSLPNVSHISVMAPLIFHDRWDYTPSGILDKTHLRFFTRKTAIELIESSGLAMTQVLETDLPRKGSRSWFFDILTAHLFRKFFAVQYILRAELKR